MRYCLALGLLLALAPVVVAQPPASPPPIKEPPKNPREAGRPGMLLRRQPDLIARKILQRMLQAEVGLAFVAHEVATDPKGHTVEQWVKRDPKRGIRREGIKPEGELFIDNGVRSWQLSNRDRKLFERESVLPQVRKRLEDAVRRLGGAIEAVRQGQDTVAGRVADIVAIVPRNGNKGASRRIWVDRETGLRLKMEEQDPEGRVRTSSYYLTLILNPTFPDDEFQTPPVPAGFKLVKDLDRKFPTLEAASKAGVNPKVPQWLPTGFELLRVKASIETPSIHLSWSNNLTTLSLMQAKGTLPVPVRKKLNGSDAGYFASPRGERTYAWTCGDTYFLLMGNLADDQLKKIADSVK